VRSAIRRGGPATSVVKEGVGSGTWGPGPPTSPGVPGEAGDAIQVRTESNGEREV
jgi:hypothetical protein